jgi:hypothetical protein
MSIAVESLISSIALNLVADNNGRVGIGTNNPDSKVDITGSVITGITWNANTFTTRTSAADNQWRDVVWAPELGLFVAVAITGSGDRIMTSPDGINWTTRSTNDNNWLGITWAPELGLFVAVAYSGTGDRVMTSPNGINWTTRSTPVDNDWSGITWAPELGLLVATSTTGTGNRVMTSPNGINWTTRSTPVDNIWNIITWAPELGLFVVVASTGTGNRVMTSPDGINWTTRSSAANNGWYGITWASELGLLVATSRAGSVMTSSDGINWTTRSSAANNNWDKVIWAPELRLLVAVAWSGTGNRVMTSPDGINWTTRSTPADNQWWGITWAPELGLFAVVAASGTGDRVMTASANTATSSILKAKEMKNSVEISNITVPYDINYNRKLTIRGDTTITGNGIFPGKVGIGTTNPLSKLSITPYDVEPKITLWDGGSTTQHFGFGISDSQLNYHVASNCRHVFYNGGKNGDGTELMCIQGDGKVGIGSTQPISELDITGSLIASGNVSGAYINGNGSGLTALNATNISSGTLNNARLPSIINTTTLIGTQVGIGTNNPLSKLSITPHVVEPKITLWDGGSTTKHYGFGVSSGQLNYHIDSINARHVFYNGGKNGNGTELMRILGDGRVGIGTNAPVSACLLHVEGSGIDYTWPASGYFFTISSSIGSAGAGGRSLNNSIYAAGAITSRRGFYATSDERIKMNSIEIIDTEALDILRKLKPRKYEYIDKMSKNTDTPVFGFYAQEVEELIPYAVGTSSEYIPNIYSQGTIENIDGENYISINSIEGLSEKLNNYEGSNIKIYYRTYPEGLDIDNIKLEDYNSCNIKIEEYDISVKEIINDTTFSINENFDINGKIFIYGHYVSDFKSLKYNSIYTIATSAIQEIDRQLQTTKEELQATKEELQTLKSFLQNKYPGEL